MNDILSSIVVLLIGSLCVVLAGRRWTSMERNGLFLSFAAHIMATVAQIVITQSGGGDMNMYMHEGTLIGRAIELDPSRFGQLWLDLLLQREPNEALPVLGAGHATGTLVALSAALNLVLRYSIWGSCFTVATIACLGKVALYAVFRELMPERLRQRMLIATLLVPSAVFWSSGIIKEAFVMAGVGPVWLGVHRILRGRPIVGALLVVGGAIPIGLLKPYTLFALAVAAGTWVGFNRLQSRSGHTGPVRIRPLYLVLSAVLVFGGVIALGQIFPKYSIENLGEDLARHQGLGVQAGGGSFYRMGDETAMSLEKQIAFAPLAVLTSLFRPFIFEANNALAFVAGLETTAIVVLFVRMLVRIGPRAALRIIMSTPVFFASLVFTLTFGMAVGLATTNFGSLSRYRMPLMPFYIALLLGLGAPPERARGTAQARPAGAPVRRPLLQQAGRLPIGARRNARS